jgi:hypothetical protein
MSDNKLGFIEQITGVLYRPRLVFKDMDEGDLTKGLLIMIVMVLLTAYSSMVYLNKIPLTVISPQLEGVDTSQLEVSMGLFAGIGSAITVLIGWVASTLLLHGLGRFSGGSGSMKRFFAMNGFTSIMGVLNQVLRIADASIQSAATLSSYYIAYRDIGSKVLKALLGTNLVNIWGLATIVLLVFAIEENYGASRSRAILIALVPSVILFIIGYFTG